MDFCTVILATDSTSSTLLRPLTDPGQRKPAHKHSTIQPERHGMDHPRTHRLRQNTRGEGNNSASTAARRSDEPNRRRLQVPWHQTREDSLRTGIDGTKHETQQRDCYSVTDDVGNQPRHELQSHGDEGEACDIVLLADPGSRMSEYEAPECDASLHFLSKKPRVQACEELTQKPAVTYPTFAGSPSR